MKVECDTYLNRYHRGMKECFVDIVYNQPITGTGNK